MSNRNTALSLYLCKVEPSEGSDSNPAATGSPSNCIQLVAPFDYDYDHAFKNPRDTLVKGADINAGAPGTSKGRVYSWQKQAWYRAFSAAPSLASPHELDAWFQMAGLAATYSGGAGSEQVAYTPANTSLPTATEYEYVDGIVAKGVGARAEVKLSFDVGGPIVVDHQSQGRVGGVVDTAVPAAPTFRTGAPLIATDGTAFSVDGYGAGDIRKFSLGLGNQVLRRDGVLAAGGVAGHRLPRRKIEWSVTLEEPTITAKDFRALVDSNADVTLHWLLGAGLYGQLDFNATGARVERVQPGNDNGLALLTISGGCYGATPFTLTGK
jgi:hypothetical protein